MPRVSGDAGTAERHAVNRPPTTEDAMAKRAGAAKARGRAAPKVRGRKTGDVLHGRFHAAVAACRRDLIVRALKEAGGSISGAARDLEITRSHLHWLMGQHGVTI